MKRLLTGFLMLLVVLFAQAQQVVHMVQRGETLESIAEKYHVSKDAITKNNPDAVESFYVGMKLFIPTPDNNQNVGSQTKTEVKTVRDDINNEDNSSNNTYYSNNVGNQTAYKTSYDREKTNTQKQESIMDIQYHAIDNGWGVGLDYAGNYFILGFDYLFGKTNDVVTTNMGYEFYIGANYRYHITDFLYIEGRVFGGYYHWEAKYKKGYEDMGLEDNKANEFFVGVSPRIGLKYGMFGISGGYRWDWIKANFKKENCLDRFNVGISITF
jgi:LysM repeat protein